MTQKGQLISLDLLFALALVFLSMGIAIKFSEINNFEWNEQQTQRELEQYGYNATLLLLSDPAITCQMTDASGVAMGAGWKVNNCIALSASITKERLGLPENYHFNISAGTQQVGETRGTEINNAFSLTFPAIVQTNSTDPRNPTISKGELYRCLQQRTTCNLQPQTVTLSIWRKRE